MVIGGQAVLHYGEPRLTKDIDMTLGADVDALPTVLACIRGIGLSVLVDDIQAFAREKGVLPCQDAASGLRVDLIFSSIPYERQAIARAVKKDIGGTAISIATLEDTVIHKLVANRPRDIEDVTSMLLKNPGIDRRYVMGWLRQFDAALEDGRLKTFERLLERTQARR
jgi:hypothetical protein